MANVDVPPVALLATLQLADSAFPAGLYAFSHGLESAVQEGYVRTAGQLEQFLANWLAWQVGPGDSVVVAGAHRAAAAGDLATLVQLDGATAATKLARELREASTRTGGQLLATAALLAPPDSVLQEYRQAVVRGDAPGTHAAAFGAAAAALGVPAPAAVLAELHSAASSLPGAALRLLRLDHRQTQGILRRQAPLLAEIAAGARPRHRWPDWREVRPCAPFAEILQMRHEAANVRLFMS